MSKRTQPNKKNSKLPKAPEITNEMSESIVTMKDKTTVTVGNPTMTITDNATLAGNSKTTMRKIKETIREIREEMKMTETETGTIDDLLI